jgi:hypothetical protein
VDPRLSTAVQTSVRWYDDMAALHTVPTAVTDGVWHALAPMPPLHSSAKTLRPGVARDTVLRTVAPYEQAGVADSFGDLDLTADGFDLLFEATWIHHRAPEPGPMPAGWTQVRDEAGLDAWVAVHGTGGIFAPGILFRSEFALMARHDGDRMSAGFVVHDAGQAVGVSNACTPAGDDLGWAEVLAVTAAVRPGLPVTDYTYGEELASALGHGFSPLGPQRVWVR